MNPRRLSTIAEDTPKARAIARQWRESGIVDPYAAQIRARPKLEPRKSFPDEWKISPERPPNPEPPESPAMSPIAPFLPILEKRPPLTKKAHTDTDLTLRRVREISQQIDAPRTPIRIITESEWARALAENQRLRQDLAFANQLRENDAKIAKDANAAKKSPWRKTKGFLKKQWQKFTKDKTDKNLENLENHLQKLP